MHQLLYKLFEKRGIKDSTELDSEEKSQFDTWDKILSKEQLSIEDIKNFCQSQIEVITGKWQDLSVEQAKKSEMIPYFVVYRTLLAAIDSPQESRRALEIQLNQLTQ